MSDLFKPVPGMPHYDGPRRRYEPSGPAKELRTTRLRMGLLLREAAEALGLTTDEVVKLETGALTFPELGDWERALVAVIKFAETSGASPPSCGACQ